MVRSDDFLLFLTAYMAPEIFRSNEGHGRAADIWSVGCVVIEMVTGKVSSADFCDRSPGHGSDFGYRV